MEGGTDNDFLKGLVKRKWRGASGGIVRAAAAAARPPFCSSFFQSAEHDDDVAAALRRSDIFYRTLRLCGDRN